MAKEKSRSYNTDIILVDIISFSTLSTSEQLELIEYLTKSYKRMINKLLSRSDMTLSKLVLGFISTGDGFYCILNPRIKGYGAVLALSFNHMSDLIAEKFPYFQGTRIAVHTGNLYEFTDILGHHNYIGDGLNHCARYLEHKDFSISTVIISKDAYEFLNNFLEMYPDYAALLLEQQFKRSRLQTFKDKHDISWSGYLIWLRKGGVINPPNINLNSLNP